MSLSLLDITSENWRQFTRLSIAESQRGQVADNVRMLVRAYVFRDGGARARGICRDGEPIVLMLQREYDADGKRYSTLAQFMIAADFQAKGYGTAVMRLWLNEVRQQRHFDAVNLCYADGHDAVRRFYEQLGFKPNGVVDGNEAVMEFRLD